MNARHTLGQLGEAHAAELLKSRGDRILERNFRCTGGELDLVTWDRDTLVFTEVRTRHPSRFGHALETVNAAKQSKLRHAARYYLLRRWRGAHPACRFDVVWVTAKNGAIAESGIIEGAFMS
jgi:putative endonuclease